MIGAEYTAPWGRYRVHREAIGEVVLRDVGAPNAFVVVTPSKLEAEYATAELVAAASSTCVPENASTPPPSWSPPPRVLDQHFTLGAPIPQRAHGVPVGDEAYWMPCFRRFEGEPHAWFVSEGAEVLCPSCRGADRDLKPENVDPPPLDAAAAMQLRQVGAQLRAVLVVSTWGRIVVAGDGCQLQAGAAVAPIAVKASRAAPFRVSDDDLEQLDQVVAAPAIAELRCDDCGRRRRVFAVTDGGRFCGACVAIPPRLVEHMRLARAAAAPATPVLTARPRATGESSDDARHDLGSFRPQPPAPRPAAAPRATTRDLWATYTAEVER